MKAGLVIEELCFCYSDDAPVLQGVNLTVPPGEICGLIGHSGSGKTSLIKCLLMLETAHRGRVSYPGGAVDFGTDDPITSGHQTALRKRMGYVPQSSLLLPFLTAEQNVMLPLTEAHGLDRQTAQDRARVALIAVGIGSLGAKPSWGMSGGQQQRVALARALAIEPALLLLDEPTAALDARSSQVVADALRKDVQVRAASALIVTHNLGFARRACDSIALLSEGHIAWHLKTADVKIEHALQELG